MTTSTRRGRAALAFLLALTAAAALLAGCAQPRPILYPNERLNAVGPEQAERDIAECRRLAEAAGADQAGNGGRGEAAARGAAAPSGRRAEPPAGRSRWRSRRA